MSAALALVIGLVAVGLNQLAFTDVHTAKYITSVKCAMCHKDQAKAWKETKHAQAKPAEDAKGIDLYRRVTGLSPETNQSAEAGVACEMCHGPGSEHMAAKPENRTKTIVNPAKLEPLEGEDASGPIKREAMVCGQCHSDLVDADGKTVVPCAYRPGDDLTKIAKIGEPKAGQPFQQFAELAGSKHYGKVACLNCHDPHNTTDQPHQLRKPVNELCSGCHADKADIKAHAPTAGDKDTCATCHMPEGRHIFAKPSG